jgi:amino acid permease
MHRRYSHEPTVSGTFNHALFAPGDQFELTFLVNSSNPWVAVVCSSAFGALGYLSVTEKSMNVLLWLINLSAVAGLVSWIVLCVGYLRFYAAMKAQGYSRDG